MWDKNKVFLPPLPLVRGDLTVDVEEGGESSHRCSHGVADLVKSTCFTGLISVRIYRSIQVSMARTLALGR
jgi:hypothetical protein